MGFNSMSEYSCFWWESFACDAEEDCTTCQFYLDYNDKLYGNLNNKKEEQIEKALQPVYEYWQLYFEIYKKDKTQQINDKKTE